MGNAPVLLLVVACILIIFQQKTKDGVFADDRNGELRRVFSLAPSLFGPP